MKTKISLFAAICFALISGIITLLPVIVQASPVFYYPGDGVSNGNEYRFYEVSHVDNVYQYEFDIHVLSGYTGNRWTDVVDSVYIKNLGANITNLSLVSAPDGVGNWFVSQNELNKNGLTGGSQSDRLGAGAKGGSNGADFTEGSVLSWVFQFETAETLNETVHIKYLYQTVDGTKIGSLGSWDYTPLPPQGQVPLPASFFLLGPGLLGVISYGRLRIKGQAKN